MAGIDKAAIGFTIAIVAIGVGFAAFGSMAQDNPPPVSAPVAPSASIETEAEKMAAEAEKMAAEAEKMAAEKAEAEKMAAEAEAEKMAAEAESSGPQTVMVDMPAGTAVPGCEETDECYVPSHVTINAGDTVEWINSDTAAHTVTGGSPADGPSGVFDSSLVLGGATYAFTFEEPGSYDYFCMVHPWMVGSVQVN